MLLGLLVVGILSQLGYRTLRKAPIEAAHSRPPAAAVQFADVTTSAGIRFVHSHGGCGRKYFVEQIASGCAFLDYDRDGWSDILLLRGTTLPGCSPDSLAENSSVVLYRNYRDGTFSEVTQRALLTFHVYALGCCVGDYDNDGYEDIYVTGWGRNYLFHNSRDGTFREVGMHAGVACRGMSTSCAWLDYDRDGWLDLYVCRYVQWDPQHDVWCGLRSRKSYCPPAHYQAQTNFLFHNNGDGAFTDVSASAGIGGPGGKSLGVATIDYDDDGSPDIAVANDGTPNFLFRNRGDGIFDDVSIESGIALAMTGTPKGGMGIDFADFDDSGRPSIVIGNLHDESLTLFRNTGRGFFEDIAFPSGVGEPSSNFLTFGAFFFDFNLDGRPDIFAANGHFQDDIAEQTNHVTYFERPLLFENRRGGNFQEVGLRSGNAMRRPLLARGAAWADYDNDGDPDILINNNHGRACLYRNEGGNRRGNWLTLLLRGTVSNRDGIGAKVTVQSSGRKQVNWVRSGSSYCSQSDLRLNTGLGNSSHVEIKVAWPSGAVQVLRGVPGNQILTVVEPSIRQQENGKP